ncbi:MAG: hypothetical protein Q9204_002659, partial [Flavoplaca sp. TL-2023a]
MRRHESVRSTSAIIYLRPGVVLKSPREIWKESAAYEKLREKIKREFLIEREIFQLLGSHPRIVKYLGYQSSAREGLVLAKANQGNLQLYIDKHHSAMSAQLRRKWCRQAIEAVDFLHQKGVIHSDLRLENYLVYMANGSTDLWLYDFGEFTTYLGQLDARETP